MSALYEIISALYIAGDLNTVDDLISPSEHNYRNHGEIIFRGMAVIAATITFVSRSPGVVKPKLYGAQDRLQLA